ncbi:NAD(+) diphosphatase [Succinimonas sp.]|uniref:NAD(+) diphosphatase n=1 Tax=Succinimonas sp. TaxID=1936151 RepID=UPI0038670ABD
MLHELNEHVFRNEYSLKRPPRESDFVMAFKGRSILVKGDGKSEPLSLPEVRLLEEREQLQYLFAIDDRAFFLFTGDAGSKNGGALEIPGFSWQDIIALRSDNPRMVCFAGATAWHLSSWYQSSRYCGKCGTATVPSEEERAMVCPSCHNIIYPRIAPAVIVGITHRDRILVTRYRDRPYRGLALIAGFCEIGETPEMTARREAMEEAGLKIRDLRYFGSQPWGLDSNLLVGYMARVDGSPEIIRDENELAEAFWVSREDLPEPDTTISLTRTMMSCFKKNGFAF